MTRVNTFINKMPVAERQFPLTLNLDGDPAMFYLLYKTTNLLNHKYYIGVHATDKLDDSYLGSGVALRKAIERYGKDHFKRETLQLVSSEQEMYELERIYVTEEIVNDPMSYNMMIGGLGASPGKNHWSYGKKFKRPNTSKTMIGRKRPKHSAIMKAKAANGELYIPRGMAKGKRSEASKQNMRDGVSKRSMMCCIKCKHTADGIWMCHLVNHHRKCHDKI